MVYDDTSGLYGTMVIFCHSFSLGKQSKGQRLFLPHPKQFAALPTWHSIPNRLVHMHPGPACIAAYYIYRFPPRANYKMHYSGTKMGHRTPGTGPHTARTHTKLGGAVHVKMSTPAPKYTYLFISQSNIVDTDIVRLGEEVVGHWKDCRECRVPVRNGIILGIEVLHC
jgi:hypothetical protein